MRNLSHALPLGRVAVTPVLVAGSLLAAVALHHAVEVPGERRLRGSSVTGTGSAPRRGAGIEEQRPRTAPEEAR